jgi:protein O-GlcNAc transferase
VAGLVRGSREFGLIIARSMNFGQMNFREKLNSGLAHHRAGRLAEAEKIYRQVLSQRPDQAEALHLLGILSAQAGKPGEGIDLIQRAISISPNNAVYHNDFGNVLKADGQIDRAIASYRESIRLKPDLADVHANLGLALDVLGQSDDAIASFREAIRLKPDYAEAHLYLGVALNAKGQFKEAITSYVQAIRLRPDLADAHKNLGDSLKSLGRLDGAIACYQQATLIKPDFTDAQINLGNAFKDAGNLNGAIAVYRKVIGLKPDFAAAHSNLIYTLHFHPGFDAGAIFAEHRRWNQQHAEPLKKLIQPHANNRDPERKLRIGYISPDFCEHPVGRFILPLLTAHDHNHFAVYCYSDVQRSDRFTELIRGHAGQWRNIVGLTHECAAQMIREDQIDILVDLTMHMADNRMLVFARKPAPVQVTYLAYCSTTGLDTMDYRLTDPHLDPPGMDDANYSEKSVRLPETYWCYPLNDQALEVSPLPALATGEVTFGCLNNFCKVSADALDAWIQMLRALPNSRLILHAHEGSHRQRVRDLLQNQGIDPNRLEFAGKVSLPEYLASHRQIDIGLDPFPCNGGTTTCDALWMGVPVVTLVGRTAVGRGGASVLRNIGLPELVAETPEQYIQIATGLANDLPRLAELRRTLRTRMQASPLMDAPRFARNVEAAYRQMWRNWCAG